jgi:hypothetical protein
MNRQYWDDDLDDLSLGDTLILVIATLAFYAVWFYGAWNLGLVVWRHL